MQPDFWKFETKEAAAHAVKNQPERPKPSLCTAIKLHSPLWRLPNYIFDESGDSTQLNLDRTETDHEYDTEDEVINVRK